MMMALMGSMVLGLGMGGFNRYGEIESRPRSPNQIYSRPIGPPTLAQIRAKEARNLRDWGREVRRTLAVRLPVPASYPPNPNETRQMRRARERSESKAWESHLKRLDRAASSPPHLQKGE
ncbi:hypothetical protein LIHA111178_08235 [Litorimonas haliclonae]